MCVQYIYIYVCVQYIYIQYIYMCVCVCTVGTNEGLMFSCNLQRTDMFKNKDDILQHLEKLGGICDCQGSRYIQDYEFE